MKITAIKTRVFKPHENLLNFIDLYLPQIKSGEIVVITSKIVALAEGRLIKKVNAKMKGEIIRTESEFALPTKYVYLTLKDGVVMADAGIDESNANGHLILLPKDSFASAQAIYQYLKTRHNLASLGVIISDSRCLPLRAGITGVALGYAGFCGLKSYHDQADIFGRPFRYSRVNVADSLATAAVLCMGEGNEQQPLALISGADLEYTAVANRAELKIDIQEDMYRPLFEHWPPA